MHWHIAGMMIPVIVSLSYLNYAVSACVGGIFAIRGLMDLGKSFCISCICETECHAVKSVYTAGQFPVVGIVRCRAYF